VNFAPAADQLRRQEIARLMQYVTPPVEALRSLTPGPFRELIADMVERLGHTVINNPTAPNLVTTKDGRKYIIACATPSDPAPAGTREIGRLHDTVITANAQRGIYVTTRSFTPDAQDYAKTAPIDLVDGAKLAQSLERSNAGATLPSSYKAMCHQCGALVQHNLDTGEALPCINGHMVTPTIARATIERPRHPRQPEPSQPSQWRDMSPKAQRRRQIRAHNHKVRARAIKQQRGGQ
jgi:hypothetical protein